MAGTNKLTLRIFSNTKAIMKDLQNKILRFLKSENGPTAVEYAIMLALIVVVCVAAIQQVGGQASGMFDEIAVDMDLMRSGQVN